MMVRCSLDWSARCAVCLLCLVTAVVQADDQRSPTVGAPGLIEEIILPGPELTGKPIQDKDPIVVRVVSATEQGQGYRYRIMFQGLEPGEYDLAQWLVRKDGSTTAGLPSISVEIKSVLEPGQIEPNELEQGWLPRLGGYRKVATAVVIGWCLVLAYLVFPRKKKVEKPPAEKPPQSLAELLQVRVEAALADPNDTTSYAELERMLFGMWRRKLGLEQVPAHDAMARIREHPQAGPLMVQLERWIHRPERDPDVELAMLLEPYRELSVDELQDQGGSG